MNDTLQTIIWNEFFNEERAANDTQAGADHAAIYAGLAAKHGVSVQDVHAIIRRGTVGVLGAG